MEYDDEPYEEKLYFPLPYEGASNLDLIDGEILVNFYLLLTNKILKNYSENDT